MWRSIGAASSVAALFALAPFACNGSDDSSAPSSDGGEAGVRHDAGRVDAAGFDADELDVSTTPTGTCSATALPPDGGTCDPDAGCTEFTIYNFSNPGSMATLSGTAYFTGQAGAVGSCDLPDCPHIDLLHYDSTTACGISVTSAGIFWNENSRDIWSSDLTGGNAQVIATETSDIYPRSTAAVGSTYYWALGTGSIRACDVTSCAATEHEVVSAADAYGLLALATDGISLFWTDNQHLSRSDLDGKNVTVLLPSVAATAIAVDHCGIYWAAGPTRNDMQSCGLREHGPRARHDHRRHEPRMDIARRRRHECLLHRSRPAAKLCDPRALTSRARSSHEPHGSLVTRLSQNPARSRTTPRFRIDQQWSSEALSPVTDRLPSASRVCPSFVLRAVEGGRCCRLLTFAHGGAHLLRCFCDDHDARVFRRATRARPNLTA